jgi:hypothetical protein
VFVVGALDETLILRGMRYHPINIENSVILLTNYCAEHHDAVFVVGALDETLILRGMRYHPIDIENSVLRAHKKIAEW